MIDFGYPWWLSYGHLPIALLAGGLLYLSRRRKWPRLIFATLLIWACVALVAVRFAFNVNSKAALPTQSFLRSGTGRVLDIGAGTGRSTIMVLEARPQATLVASDLFAGSFDMHFGREGKPQDRLLRNLKAAGVDGRATIETADMRKMPFEPASFDALVSSYAIDHLSRDGVQQTMRECARVVKPGGEFLLSVVSNDKWARFLFGPLLSHGATRRADWWTAQLNEAGFEVLEQGTQPVTLYILARRKV